MPENPTPAMRKIQRVVFTPQIPNPPRVPERNHYGEAGDELVDSAAKEAAQEAVAGDMYIRADDSRTHMKHVILGQSQIEWNRTE
ncbi:hypothetical protein JTB14_034211 [Gonioctena quinquepunctata]|nr:hypothetical protein JTB14_034211 [Gonioctena quinquepunctata]